MRVALVIVAALTTSACASAAPADPSATRFATLSEACSKRGGALVPSFRGFGVGGGYECQAVSGGADARTLPTLTEVR